MIESIIEQGTSVLTHKLSAQAASEASDQQVLNVAAEIHRLHRIVHDMLATDGRDTDEIPGFTARADDLALLIVEFCGLRAASLGGLLVKAAIAIRFQPYEGDRGGRIAMSLAHDVCSLAEVDGLDR